MDFDQVAVNGVNSNTSIILGKGSGIVIDRSGEITYYNYRDKDFYVGSLAFPYFFTLLNGEGDFDNEERKRQSMVSCTSFVPF